MPDRVYSKDKTASILLKPSLKKEIITNYLDSVSIKDNNWLNFAKFIQKLKD